MLPVLPFILRRDSKSENRNKGGKAGLGVSRRPANPVYTLEPGSPFSPSLTPTDGGTHANNPPNPAINNLIVHIVPTPSAT